MSLDNKPPVQTHPANLYIEVAVNIPQVSGLYHYHVPEALCSQVTTGSLVVVPFGKRQVQGIALRILDNPEVTNTRAIEAVIDPQPVVTLPQMELARWLSHASLAPLAACFSPMLPPGLGQQADTLYHLNAKAAELSKLNDVQARLVHLLEQRGDLRGRQIDTAMPRVHWKTAARGLIQHGWLATRPVLQMPSMRPKTVRTAQLACAPQEAQTRMEQLGRAGSAAVQRRQAMLRFLMKDPLPVEVAWVYAASQGTLQDLQKLAEAGLVILGENEIWRDPLEKIIPPPSEPPTLTQAQQLAWDRIDQAIQARARGAPCPPPFLLHGITGSGKTEMYLRAVEETIRQGKQAIIMVPEIALTPQTVRRFLARFPGQVGLVHSRLSAGERYDTWRRARAGTLPVIVGPRSALFTPLPNLGLIVLDECHDPAYHQEELPPNYSTVDTAVVYARLTNSLLLLGSATPDVALTYRAHQEGWTILSLPVRILAHRQTVQAELEQMGITESTLQETTSENGRTAVSRNLPPVKIVDMRQELKAGNRTIFSRALQEALQQTLEARQQAILFLNRRGTATYVFCRQCGYTLQCPRCDLPLTFHTDQNALVCHTCNYHRQSPKTCPKCASPHIRHFGTGTEKVESDVQALFPSARILRWDAETTRQKGSHDILLQTFLNHQADILVGTQMLAKGLDLPLVTLVGVILADVSLQLPDYTAGERTFQLLTQVAGRAGRSLLGGRVILQTFQPDHYAIRAAAQHDYAGFYRRELEYRKELRYPPFTHLVRLETRGPDSARVEADARSLANQITGWIQQGDFRETEMIGPAPCFFGRQNGLYRWQIILRGPDPASLLRGRALGDWRVEVNPTSLL